LIEDDEGVRFELEMEDRTALVRAQALVRGALKGTGIDPSSVQRSVHDSWS
jgi:hypothetical protein